MDPAIESATRWLLDRQDPAGWWCGELETNVTMTAEHVLLLRFLRLDAELDRLKDGAVRHILSCQREDGSWSLYYAAPADLSTTIEAYAALKVLGVAPASHPMQRALAVIHRLGGVTRARVFTKIWLALFGQYPWAGVPSMPPELAYLPPWMPLNLYDFSCWARGTIAPLLIVMTRKPRRPLGCSLAELVVPGTTAALRHVPGSGFFWWTDKLLKLYDRFPWHPGRATARRRLVDWIVARQEADGSWGGIQPPWVYSLIALNLEGMRPDNPVMRRGIEGLHKVFAVEDEGGWRLQACMSPVWDTAWAMLALRRAGLMPDHPALCRATAWMLQEQIDGGGDWQVRAGNIPCGGWAFEFDNDTYPDIDDTAVIVVALLEAGRTCGHTAGGAGVPGNTAAGSSISGGAGVSPTLVSTATAAPGRADILSAPSHGSAAAPPVALVDDAIARAARWVVAMRSKNGAWGAFDKDNTCDLVYKLPFSDFGALLDPPSEDVTAHVLEMLAHVDVPGRTRLIRSAVAYLRHTQRPDGSWFGRWGVNYIYGTWCVMTALAALRDAQGYAVQDMIDRGAAWLLAHQNDDGGWGESCYSYEDASFAGVGESTASQTAWALLALQAAGLGAHAACGRGRGYLRQTQVGGTWDERYFTGTGFPKDFYINYHLYRHVFPLMALAGGPS